MADAIHELPPFAVVVSHHVSDWDNWKPVFDAHEDARRAAGFVGHHINRGEDDANQLSLYLAISDLEQAKAFADSQELKEAMEKAGVDGPPEMTWMTPVREAVVWDRELPAFIISHQVDDFDAWLAGYDGAADLQRQKGIVGHAANRSLDDPSVAIVYHQAESFEALRAFLADPDLQAAMTEAGVTGELDISFWTGGWAKRY